MEKFFEIYVGLAQLVLIFAILYVFLNGLTCL